MPRTAQTRGRCGYCGREMTCTGLGRHLRSCAERRKATEQADGRAGPNERLHHLQVRDSYGLGYWLHLEMNGSATLFDLDYYLRRIWLECCGHMSAFDIRRVQYVESPEESFGFYDCESLDAEANEVFEPGLAFTHEYDFGTTTELSLRVVDQRSGKPTTDHDVALMARNDPLRVPALRDMRRARAGDLPPMLLPKLQSLGGSCLRRSRGRARRTRRLRQDAHIQLAQIGRLRVRRTGGATLLRETRRRAAAPSTRKSTLAPYPPPPLQSNLPSCGPHGNPIPARGQDS